MNHRFDCCIIKFDNIFDSIFVGKKYKGKRNLTLKLCQRNNKLVKNALKNCYDTTIIIDTRSDYLLVIDQIPIYKYFKLIENDKLEFYDDIQIVHWSNTKLQRCIDLSINRTRWDKLYELNELYNLQLFKDDITDYEDDQYESEIERKNVSYKKAPMYSQFLKQKHLEY